MGFSVKAGLAIGVVAAVGVGGFLLLRSFNHFASVERDFAGVCAPVTGLAGPEDLQIDARSGKAFISSFDRRSADARRGGVFAVDLDDPLAQDNWRDRTSGVPVAFEPLGLNVYDDGEHRRLFVVNAAAGSVELFDIGEDGALTHLETFVERRLTSPNDVVGVGPRAFYVSNDVESGRDSLIAQLEFLAKSASGKVMYFDGSTWRVAADGLRFANGVAVSPDGETFFAAETTGAAIRVYDRNPATGLLTAARVVPMGAAVDNINVDEDGALWIGAHPKPLLLPRVMRNEAAAAPSEVIRLAPGATEAETVYMDDGAEISASTSAARLGSTLLIGSLVEKKFLLCKLPGPRR